MKMYKGKIVLNMKKVLFMATVATMVGSLGAIAHAAESSQFVESSYEELYSNLRANQGEEGRVHLSTFVNASEFKIEKDLIPFNYNDDMKGYVTGKKGGTFNTSFVGPKIFGNVADVIRQMEIEAKKRAAGIEEIYDATKKITDLYNVEDITVEINNICLLNCTIREGQLVSARVHNRDMLYKGVVYPKGHKLTLQK